MSQTNIHAWERLFSNRDCYIYSSPTNFLHDPKAP